MIETAVTDDHRGARLDRFLATLPAVGSRTVAERLLTEGRVRVDGADRHKAYRVLPGMAVAIDIDPVEPGPLIVDHTVPFTIVHADDDLLVVDKPAGVVVHPAPGTEGGTLVHGLVDEGIAGGDDDERPGVIHRLDKDTSGLLVVARNEAAFTALGSAMRRRAIVREYVALVHGRPAARAGRIEAPIGRDRGKGRMAIDGTAAREAVTHFAIAETFEATTLLRVTLGTGRTHQIRVHLEAIGHPVVGDPLYGSPGAETYGLDRQFLHACRLVLPHPASGDQLELTSPLPVDLAAVLAQVRR